MSPILKNNRIVGNAGWIVFCKIAQSVLSIVVTAISARFLGPSNYGIISYAASIVSFVSPIALLGISNVIVQELINSDNKDGLVLGTSITLSFISSFACLLGIFSFSLIVDILTKLLYPKASAVVFQTKRSEGYFKKVNLKNATIIANPIAVKCFAKEPTKGKVVTVGRPTKQKNHIILLHAFYETLKKIPYANLYIFGKGEMREQLLKLSEELDISEHVHLMGNVFDIHEQIADAELFVLSSDYEGLSNALLEALMMGLSCISTNCAGADEYIKPYVNGILVNIGDAEELASKMIELLSDRNKAKALGEEAHRNSGAFDKKNVLKQWYALINEVSR